MNATREELLNFLKEAEAREDYETANAVLDKIEALQTGNTQQRESYGEPVQNEQGQYQVGGNQLDVDIGKDIIAPPVEAALSLGTGAAADIYGNYVAAPDMLNQQGPITKERVANRFTYQPRTAGGRHLLETFGQYFKPVSDAMESTRLGDEAREAGIPEPIAKNLEGIPEFVGAAITPIGAAGTRAASRPAFRTNIPDKPRIDPKTAELRSLDDKGVIKARLVNKQGGAGTAGYKLENLALKKDPLQKAALSQGWSDKQVGYIATRSPQEKIQYRKIIANAEKYFDTPGTNTMPSDPIGNTLVRQIDFARNQKTRLGKLLDKIANDRLGGITVNASPLMDDAIRIVDDLGGQIEKGKVKFGTESDLFNQPGNQRAVQALFDKVRSLGPNPTALQVHKFKKWLTEDLDFDSSPLAKTRESGTSKAIDARLKSLRAAANQVLRDSSDAYAKTNDTFSDAADALKTLQKGIGNVDASADVADAALGVSARRLLNNTQARQSMLSGVKKINEFNEKYNGITGEGNLAAQMQFIDELENMWGTFSPYGVKGQMGEATKNVIQNPTLMTAGREAVGMTAKQINKMRVNRAKQIRTMKELLANY